MLFVPAGVVDQLGPPLADVVPPRDRSARRAIFRHCCHSWIADAGLAAPAVVLAVAMLTSRFRAKETFVNFTGPKIKKSRALGIALTPKAQKYMAKRPNPPGQHGGKRRRRPSDYGLQLLEKQRLRFQYNVSESYLSKTYAAAARLPGSTGDNMMQLLESRLDALVLRAGFAISIYAARQYVNHGHFEVNGRKANIASQRLKPGDVVTVRERSRKSVIFNDLRADGQVMPYVTVAGDKYSFRFDYIPPREEIPVLCAEHLVVEYYSR
jgi:small subunit ribosomal protein S4